MEQCPDINPTSAASHILWLKWTFDTESNLKRPVKSRVKASTQQIFYFKYRSSFKICPKYKNEQYNMFAVGQPQHPWFTNWWTALKEDLILLPGPVLKPVNPSICWAGVSKLVYSIGQFLGPITTSLSFFSKVVTNQLIPFASAMIFTPLIFFNQFR